MKTKERKTTRAMSAAVTALSHGYCAASGSGPLTAMSFGEACAHVSCQWSQAKYTAVPTAAEATISQKYNSWSFSLLDTSHAPLCVPSRERSLA